jgi:hypothetical protein
MGWSTHHPVGLIYHSPQHCFRGHTLLCTGGGQHAYLIDMEGRVCHRWHSPEGIEYAYLLPNGHLLLRTHAPKDAGGAETIGGSSAALLELDWEGNLVWEFRNPMVHHDFRRLPNGNTLALLFERMPAELSAQVRGGFTTDSDPQEMIGDLVQEVTPDGRVVWEWHSWQHLRVEEDIICPLEGRREWTHQNTLSLMPNGDLLVSFRQTSVIGIVDRTNSRFKWKWGPGQISHQHHPTYLDNGRILLFDNGAHRRGVNYSRVIEVDPQTNQIAWEYRGEPPISFYSYNISSAERLPNGNTLICEGAPGRIFEATPECRIVWEYINPFAVQRPSRLMMQTEAGTTRIAAGGVTEHSNAMFRAHRYGPDHPALAGRDLDPARYANLNRLYAAGQARGEAG